MSYQVVKEFTDLQDKNYLYKVGDTYPREGREVTEERVAELAGSHNRRKQPMIEAGKEPEPEESTGKPDGEESQEVAPAQKETSKRTPKKGS